MPQKQVALKQRLLDPGILVDQQIRKAMQNGWLSIDPFDQESLEPATYDLRIGDIAVVSTSSKPINLRETPLLTIEPFAAALVQTDEILRLSQKVVGRLGPRSNLLRHGIFVSAGPQIDPGFYGRLFVNLLNVTEHPFLIRHRSPFLTVEFHALSQEPSRPYTGPNQGRTELSEEMINNILSRGGPSLKDIHRDLLELQAPMKSAAAVSQEVPNLVSLQQEIIRLTSEVLGGLKESLGSRSTPLTVPITTLEPEPFDLLKEIPATVQAVDQGYTATFFDANISMSGDTQEEAVSNLKGLILDIFNDLESESEKRLGPEPLRQLKILRSYIRKKAL